MTALLAHFKSQTQDLITILKKKTSLHIIISTKICTVMLRSMRLSTSKSSSSSPNGLISPSATYNLNIRAGIINDAPFFI